MVKNKKGTSIYFNASTTTWLNSIPFVQQLWKSLKRIDPPKELMLNSSFEHKSTKKTKQTHNLCWWMGGRASKRSRGSSLPVMMEPVPTDGTANQREMPHNVEQLKKSLGKQRLGTAKKTRQLDCSNMKLHALPPQVSPMPPPLQTKCPQMWL